MYWGGQSTFLLGLCTAARHLPARRHMDDAADKENLHKESTAARTLVQASVVALLALAVLLLLRAAEAFLAVFGGVLFAILFNSAARWIQSRTPMPYSLALALSAGMPALLLGLGLSFGASAIADQAAELAKRVPEAAQRLEENLRQWSLTNQLLEQQERLKSLMPEGSKAAGALGGFFSSSFGALGNFVIALAVGLFLAINPSLYVNGLVHLFPLSKRPRARDVLEAVGSSLKLWLAAKFAAMLAIGVLTTVGLWLLSIELALVLGFVAAVLSFVPNFGPIIALIPAALMGLMNGPEKMLYVVLLYMGIQALESYVLTPILQQRMVDLPPALTIIVQVLMGVVVGVMGLIFAAPLTAAAMVMVQMWYIQDILGDRQMAGHRPV
ncbi:MAG: AI-2E family transporter [Comamonadaceae bacterium]|nr:AI-2E family transporter [Comamonadaceae bacterium]